MSHAAAIGFWSQTATAPSYPACLDDAHHWWYDATDLSTVTKDGSNLVSVWAAKGGAPTGKNLLQADGSKQPLWVSPGTIRFDGIDNFLKSAAFTWNQPEFIYILFKQITWTLNDVVFDGNASYSGRLRQRVTTPGLRVGAGTETASLSGLAVNTWGIVRCLIQSVNGKMQINADAPDIRGLGTANMGGFTLGAEPGAGSYSNIEVKDIVCVNIDDAANEAEIYNWLVTRKP